ncbi:hypothetical protein PENFLA_c045G03245 [Penicillium flavigenum]|uniref:NACHT domain-containing protein n=1 Tax=Penicillium flavigenum TaxID=254877 RepID=A0A1V6SJ98_9EURO|nr:hypothetical protein PENFLA_c045G03245 [Penicillium flavigenum]
MDMSRRNESDGQGQGVHLCQVHPTSEDDTKTEIDIIAIHGLDTKSPDTWVWRSSSTDKDGINWLAHPDMLPDKAKRARIFYCDWPARLFNEQSTIEMTVTELARRLLLAIHSRPGAEKNRPLLFIASCLGGVILSQALVIAARSGSEYASLWRATGAVVFLATPFRGTAFEDIARAAVSFLKVYARLADKVVTKLLESVTMSTPFLQELIGEFTRICQQRDPRCQLTIFYETKKGNLLRKARFLPQLAADFLNEPKVLVDSGSARLDIVTDPVALERTHALMNKFSGPDDPAYIAVAGKIQILMNEICEAPPLKKADNWIRYNHYTADRLEIERLSGETLSMEQCYINLAIVEQPGEIESRLDEGDAQRSSPFSLAARLKVETPDKGIQVDLRTVFEKCERLKRSTVETRRILIRGRAGVGKTTLCKRIVYDFIYHGTWKDLFDRILWVPLRRLKKEPKRGYNFEDLFFQEYLSQNPKGRDLAHELWVALDATKYCRTLFVLDGLDEVSGELDESSEVFRFLKSLLKQPNVIITTRPYGSLPYWLKRTFDLELETIGFYPDQVKNYIKNAFTSPETGETDSETVDKVQSFLQKHQLIQGLVRIPIQLDALCYTWGTFGDKNLPQTMTDIYKAIEESLWKKDILRLEKQHDGHPLLRVYIENVDLSQVEDLIEDEIYLLEGLAFSGLYSDVINFDSEHRTAISRQFRRPGTNILLDKTLPRLSFLRTTDPSSKKRDRNYHFLHLTFQEYFAARYFVRQWKARKPLICLGLSTGRNELVGPVEFLKRYKYHGRYDILWRFVAGLLDAEEEAEMLRFLRKIEEEPLDLLGPTHQRLVMHCLSEVRHSFPLRRKLEGHLSRWLVFQCKKLNKWDERFEWRDTLASEHEFPEQAIADTLQKEGDEVRIITLRSMESRHKVSLSVTGIITSWLQGKISDRLTRSILNLFRTSGDQLPGNAVNAIAARLEDQNPGVRMAAIDALGCQSNLPEGTLNQIAARLDDQYPDIRITAIDALGRQSNLPEGTLNQIAAQLDDQDLRVGNAAISALLGQLEYQHHPCVRIAAIKALGHQSSLPEGTLSQIAARLEDQDPEVRMATIDALRLWNLSEDMLNLNQVAVQLDDQDHPGVRIAAINALVEQANLPEGTLNKVAARLEDQYPDIRIAAIYVLRRRSNLSEVILNQIAARLEDQDPSIREAAIDALRSQSNLSERTLNHIVAQLEDEDLGVRRAAIHALGRQSNLPEGTLNQIAAQLEDQDPRIKEAAIHALGRQSNLPEGILSQIAARLEDQGWEVQFAAINALGCQSNVPEGTLNQVAARLGDQNLNVRMSASHALRRQSNLPLGTLNQIVARLGHLDPDTRIAAIEALEGQSKLPEGTLKQIAARLENQGWEVRCAINALGRQSNLPEGTLNRIAARLEDQHEYVRIAAVEALGRQSKLPKVTLNQIAAQLKNRRFIELFEFDQLTSMLMQRPEFHSVCLVGGHAEGLFPLLMTHSFGNHLAWYLYGGKSCLETDNRLGSVELLNEQSSLEVAIKRARDDAAAPAIAVSHEVEGSA